MFKWKLIPLLIISICSFIEIQAQEEEERKGQFYLAPDIGLLFGTVTRIEFSPLLGYYLTNRLTLAGGFRYEYYKDSRNYYGYTSYSTSIYGPRLQARFILIHNIDNILPIRLNAGLFILAEQEFLSLERRYFDFPNYDEDGRFFKPITLIGGGISQQAGRNSFFNVMVLYDLNNDISSPYVNPIIRIGFQIGLVKK